MTIDKVVARLTAKPPFSVFAADAPKIDGETVPRRHPKAVRTFREKPDDAISTTYELVKVSAKNYGGSRCMGSRKLLKTHNETKKVKKIIDGQEKEVDKSWTFFELSPYTYVSYTEYELLTLQLGAGFRKLGLETGDRVHLYAATGANWIAMSHAAGSQSMAIVTAYDSLGEEGVKYSMQATRSKIVFLDPHLLPTMTKVLKELSDVKTIVWNSHYEVNQEHLESLRSTHPAITVLSFEELRKLGEDNPVDPVAPKPDDLACIMYTSGSTGTPKGVNLTHRNVIAAIAGISTVVQDYIGPGDGLLAYLPSAHILEFVFENAAIYWGATLGYGNPKTLADSSVKNCSGDIKEFKPSIMVGVPAVWESVKKGIIAKVNDGSPLVRNLFWGAMWAKKRLLKHGLPGVGVIDAVVFKKLKEATGGRLKVCMSGGGPIAKETQEFISMAICPMMIGYGLTETTAMGCLMNPKEWNISNMGAMPSCVELKLVDYPEAGYSVANKPHPQGEIWIRGPAVMSSYHDNPAESTSCLTKDGWFKTGDIGEVDSFGHFRLIDRKKNLIKTLNGEYIALEKLESVYRTAPVVANVCVYAAESKTKPIAIIVPAEPALKKLAASAGIEGDIGVLVHNKKVQAMVLSELQAAGKVGGLAGIEIIEGVVLSDDEWTPQNNMTTAAQKLNRKNILNRFQKEVDEAYKSASG